MAGSQTPLFKSNIHSVPHVHLAGETCPTCDQVIPQDRYEEFKKRIETRQRERANEVAARLQDDFVRQRQQIADQARADALASFDKERAAFAEKLTTTRDEARAEAEAQAQTKLVAAADEKQKLEAQLKAQLDAATEIAQAAKSAEASLSAQLHQERTASAAAIAKEKADATAREEVIRVTAMEAAKLVVQDQLDGAEKAKLDAEARLAETKHASEKAKAEFEGQLSARLTEQRQALEQAGIEALNKERAAAYDDKLKLSAKMEDLQRSLDKKTAEELGDVPEVELFDALKADFPGDKIDRINKGQPGADILHIVMLNGQECGRIVYDSKNHSSWRNDFVTKLSTDKMAARADHAILSSRKFPQGARQLHVQDGIVVVSPGRASTVAWIIREQVVRMYTLRMSTDAKAQKTAAVYDFITSERFVGIMQRLDTQTNSLLELQAKEMEAHNRVWKQQGTMIRTIQKSCGELTNELDILIGVANACGTDHE